MNKKEILIKKLYDSIMENGTLSTRANELYDKTDERIENKIYVKKVNTDFYINGTSVKMLSIASDNESFSGTSTADVRIGCENRNNTWTNIFATECDGALLDAINKELEK